MTETIFMIHGMWGGPWYWENYKSLFEKEGYTCVTTTLRFHDMNPKDAPDPRLGTTSLLDYAEDLEQEIRQLGVKPIVVGHSMGGLLAQILGSRGLAKALVLLTPASPAGIMALTPSVMKSFWSMQTTWGFWKKPMRQTFNEAAYSMLHLLPPNEQKEAYDKFVYESGRAAFEVGYWLIDSKKASGVNESKVTCPVLVIAGAEDRITPASVVRQVARKYKAVSTYKEFDNHAHWVVAEPGWQEIAEFVKDWLKHTLAEHA
ncbi:MAG: alpha/beta hydrolase [Bacteroidetes bacterium]|nr:alpha/beta hydrolase [Bacteroidota bacterium]MCL5738135.1 alpha/beta hydrolase [Bacteroidota bacterium]